MTTASSPRRRQVRSTRGPRRAPLGDLVGEGQRPPPPARGPGGPGAVEERREERGPGALVPGLAEDRGEQRHLPVGEPGEVGLQDQVRHVLVAVEEVDRAPDVEDPRRLPQRLRQLRRGPALEAPRAGWPPPPPGAGPGPPTSPRIAGARASSDPRRTLSGAPRVSVARLIASPSRTPCPETMTSSAPRTSMRVSTTSPPPATESRRSWFRPGVRPRFLSRSFSRPRVISRSRRRDSVNPWRREIGYPDARCSTRARFRRVPPVPTSPSPPARGASARVRQHLAHVLADPAHLAGGGWVGAQERVRHPQGPQRDAGGPQHPPGVEPGDLQRAAPEVELDPVLHGKPARPPRGSRSGPPRTPERRRISSPSSRRTRRRNAGPFGASRKAEVPDRHEAAHPRAPAHRPKVPERLQDPLQGLRRAPPLRRPGPAPGAGRPGSRPGSAGAPRPRAGRR